MASLFSKLKRVSEQKRNSGASLSRSPNVSVRAGQEREQSSFRHSFSSTLNSSLEEYSRDESFDLLPKTDYTYARSGSYSPRHLRKSYVNPNMSRRRLRGVVTPPVSMLDDSDSDLDLDADLNREQNMAAQNRVVTTETVNYSYSSTGAGASHGAFQNRLLQSGELDVDSDEGELDGGEPVLAGNIRIKDKELADRENMRIQQAQQSEDTRYRHYYGGMVLRSGSHLKGQNVRRFLDSHDANRRKSTSVIGQSSADFTSNALDARQSSSTVGVYDRRRSDNPAYDAGRSEASLTTTTTVTKTVTEIEEEDLNKNNNARQRRSSRSPGRRKGGERIELQLSSGPESKRISDEYQKENTHRIDHMYGLDQTEDFSDSDSYTSSSLTSSEGYWQSAQGQGRKRQQGFLVRAAVFITTVVTTVVATSYQVVRPVVEPVWRYMVKPIVKQAQRGGGWLWTQLTTVARYFILLDAWMLSRNARRNCCLCLPLFLLLPLLLYGGHYVSHMLPSDPAYFTAPFFTGQKVSHVHQVNTQQTINLHNEVKQILLQLQSEKRDWLTKAEIETLVQGMLNPQVESLRVSLLNIANEGNSDQAALKVDQNDAKLRLVALEEQMAALQAKAKVMEKDLADSRNQFLGALTGDRDSHAENLAALESALAKLRGQLTALEGSYSDLVAHSKTCCINDADLTSTIRSNVDAMIVEIFGKDGKGGGAGSNAFAGWLNQNYVDRKEFERQLRLLTVDITDRINSGLEAQRSAHGSSLVMPAGAAAISEDAVKVIVENALLKFSADRTGLPDYALESAGGSVVSVRCSETYYRKTALISVFGIPLWYTSNSPRTVIQPEVHPGQCWAFKGHSGYIVIQLAVAIRPTGFSLEHIPKSLSMTGSIDSAPRDFTVFGLHSETDTLGVNLGNFTYQTVGNPIQHFDVQIGNPGVFSYMELRVMNNHGNKDYTCLYRFRVHGVPQDGYL